ncbi:lanthionine synthetase C family protein [Embleya sp. NPDC005575]|uniref:lanthionine synthetase C family protein n=1 Tax=Embleya sp. NPDC005575 TaxID=3156892 RepID=UPI0033AD4FF0
MVESTIDTVVPRHADRARATVTRVLDRLADPEAVAADTNAAAAESWSGEGTPPWAELSLSSGFPGVSLAFSGTTSRGPEHTARAHAYLARAMAVLARERFPAGGVFDGPGSVAVATLVAHHATGGYVSALARLDDHQRRVVHAALPRPRTNMPLATNAEFETVRGLSGIGRYLLARVTAGGEAGAAELRMVLSYLVGLADGEITHRGRKVPRWWTLAAPKLGQEAELPDGHLNLGLSHGVAGPLALLSLSWRAGVQVPGHGGAIERLVALLTECAVPAGDALWWPPFRTLHEWVADPDPDAKAPRPSWCYGVPGVSRAIQLAALALDRPDWHDLTRRSLTGLLDTPIADWGIDDPALCHGWGGMLHLLGLLAEHLDDARLPCVRDELAALILAQYHDEYRFGFRTTMTDVPQGADVPAFLEGAAGVALALDAYAEGRATAGWDQALLVV